MSVHFDMANQRWECEQPDGTSLIFNTITQAWELDDGSTSGEQELIAQQQQAYGPTIVSTNSPPRLHPLDPEASTSKRGLSPSDDPPAKKQKQKKSRPAKDPSAKRETSAIFVTNLPLGEGETTVERLQETFSKAGLIMEDGDGEARVKLYYEKAEEGKRPKFKGEALIVYLQSDSVTLATQLFDDTYLVIGRGTGPGGRDVLADSDGTMKVNKAVWESKASATVKKDAPVVLSGTGIKKVDIEKQKMGKRREKLKAKLNDWSSDDEAPSSAASRAKNAKLVILKGMFTLDELDEDPALLLDLKEEVREQCEVMGEVLKVMLYDGEEEGVMTVKFKEDSAALACVAKMNNRFFGGRSLSAFISPTAIKFRKADSRLKAPLASAASDANVTVGGASAQLTEEESEEAKAAKEKERLEKYAEYLEREG